MRKSEESEEKVTEYTLEGLIKIFGEHAAAYERQIEEWKIQKGNENIPFDDFNLPKAFLFILNEIKGLKDA